LHYFERAVNYAEDEKTCSVSSFLVISFTDTLRVFHFHAFAGSELYPGYDKGIFPDLEMQGFRKRELKILSKTIAIVQQVGNGVRWRIRGYRKIAMMRARILTTLALDMQMLRKRGDTT
jgi:hypothetical protein